MIVRLACGRYSSTLSLFFMCKQVGSVCVDWLEQTPEFPD